MSYAILFIIIAVLLAATAIVQGGWLYSLLWPALSFGIIALGYACLGPRVYGKSQRGVLSPIHQLLLLPYLLYQRSVWYAMRLVTRESAYDQLTNNIFVGRRLLSHEFPDNIDHVIDLTSEFTEPNALRSVSYHSFPVLDGAGPSPDQLRDRTAQVSSLAGNIYIHCAEGHGRTGLFTAALLLHLGHSKTPDEALRFIKSKRRGIRLGKQQMVALNAVYHAVNRTHHEANKTGN